MIAAHDKTPGARHGGAFGGFIGTVSEAIDLIGQYRDAGIDLLIDSDPRDDLEARELFVSDVMPRSA